ncbi:MAG TPA: CHASE3 domain-containing protein [Bacteroidia bacterium]|nr:CHASE3 domain-containing protein [Bacteroidia bacterium]
MTSAKLKASIYLLIGVISLFLIAAVFFSLFSIGRLKSNLAIQVHTTTVMLTLNDNLISLLNAETGERGFIITGDTNYLEPYKMALQNIAGNIKQLRTLTIDNPVQRQNVDTLEIYVNKKLSRIATILSLKKQGAEKTIKMIVLTGEGKDIMDRIRVINQSMLTEEVRLREERTANTNKSVANAQLVLIGEGIFSLIITLFLAYIILRELARRAKAEKIINDFNIELKWKNKELEQFAYIASHDLQEPLRSVSNFSTLLLQKLEQDPDKEVHKYLNFVIGGAQRMSRLIFDLLEYSRIGKGMAKIQLDCNELLREVLTDMSASIKESGAVIHTEKLPVVNGFIYLKLLFQNLISNAIKFRKAGSYPIINISATDRGNEFVFSIKDNGIGIEKPYYDRIFIIFQRLHTREEYEGTGIGLSQCKKIIELHGGEIWVESELGKGSTFNFTIPKT